METSFLLRASKRIRVPSRHLFRQHRYESTSKPSTQQAIPLGNYYASILSSESSSPQPPAAAALPSTPAITTKSVDSPSEPSILFSSRLSSPLERRSEIQKKSVLVAGVWVPPRPDNPDNCCMSGCVNCVWDRYRDELEEWAAAKHEADTAMRKEGTLSKAKKRRRKKDGPGDIAGTGLMLGEAEEGAEHTMLSMNDDGDGSVANSGAGIEPNWSSEELFKGIPVGIREFMKQEKRLKEKHAREGTRRG